MRLVFYIHCLVICINGLHAQRIQDIIIEPDTAGKVITYGSTINFKFYLVTKKGNQKEVGYSRVDKLISCSTTSTECTVYNSRLSFPSKTSNKGLMSAIVRFTAVKPDDLTLDKSFEIKMNFKSAVSLNFKGKNGTSGTKGDKGAIPIILRDGKPGEVGGHGGEGSKGKTVTVRIKKELDDYFKREILFLYVKDSISNTEFIYRSLFPDKGIDINVSGGDGGPGGSGGNGSNGKNGIEDKRAGDGGAGGFGGNGGNGGMGGKVTVIAHTNASEIVGFLRIDNAGGAPGFPGKGGTGGSGGTGSSSGNSGKSGGDGTMGLPGAQGPNFELRVEEF